MSNLYLALIIVLGILALPMILLILWEIYKFIKEDIIMNIAYKFDLFGVREKWLKEHPNWDKPYEGNSMLGGFLHHLGRKERPW